MNILVYGAGPLGSLFASKLYEAGHSVSLLARGQRLADLRMHEVVMVNWQTSEQIISHPADCRTADSQDAYDLVLVIMRKNRDLEILPILAANQHTPNILFLMNNAAGPGDLVQALGTQRVLIGFPMAAGYRHEHVVYYLSGSKPDDKAMIPIGEVDGSIAQSGSRLEVSLPA